MYIKRESMGLVCLVTFALCCTQGISTPGVKAKTKVLQLMMEVFLTSL